VIDNYDLFDIYDRQQERWLASLPKCDLCNEPIQDEYGYMINGNLICEECLIQNFRFFIDVG
jgi:formylmethanofuran dehydrogenase subunit E